MRRSRLSMALACLALGFAIPATVLAAGGGPVKTSATWTATASGPQVAWNASAFAPTTCQLVAFGGTTGSALPSSTSLFDPAAGSWTSVAGKRTGPAARTQPQLVWDASRQRIVMFGGRSPSGGVLQDTWAFDPAARTWAPLVTSCRKGTCPPARWGHGMVWSSLLGKVLLFGGTRQERDPLVFFDDFWTFGSAWASVTVTGPRPGGRYIFGMAEDMATGLIVVYGGVGLDAHGGAVFGLNDTWLFDPRTNTWTGVTTPTHPPAYGEVAMGWSPSIGAVVMTGGSDYVGRMVAEPGTWAFDMARRDWVRVTATGGPPSPRKEATLTADTCHGTAILYAGEDGWLPSGFLDRTWILR